MIVKIKNKIKTNNTNNKFYFLLYKALVISHEIKILYYLISLIKLYYLIENKILIL